MSSDGKPARPEDVVLYQAVRTRIEHENGLIVSRLAWLMASESFLFTAYAIVLNGITTPGISSGIHHARLIQLIPIVGMASSALIFVGILAAIKAIGWIYGQFRAREMDETSLGLPKIHTPVPLVVAGLAAPIILPALFAAVWLYLLLNRPA